MSHQRSRDHRSDRRYNRQEDDVPQTSSGMSMGAMIAICILLLVFSCAVAFGVWWFLFRDRIGGRWLLLSKDRGGVVTLTPNLKGGYDASFAPASAQPLVSSATMQKIFAVPAETVKVNLTVNKDASGNLKIDDALKVPDACRVPVYDKDSRLLRVCSQMDLARIRDRAWWQILPIRHPLAGIWSVDGKPAESMEIVELETVDNKLALVDQGSGSLMTIVGAGVPGSVGIYSVNSGGTLKPNATGTQLTFTKDDTREPTVTLTRKQ